MKAIGTITNYFPFLEEDTIKFLQSTMNKALDYHDFILRLGQHVCEENVSSELVFVAATQASFVRAKEILAKIKNKYSDHPEIVIWTFTYYGPTDRALYRNEYHEILGKVIDSTLPDWMLFDIYSFTEPFFTANPTETREVLAKIANLLQHNQELESFRYRYHGLLAEIHEAEGSLVCALLEFQRAIDAAKKADDIFGYMEQIGSVGFFLRNHNASDAFDYIEEYNKISLELNLPWFMYLARHYMGLIYLVRGEYDMAIECQYAGAEIFFKNTAPSSTLSAALSHFYTDIGGRDNALYWAEEALRITGGKGDSMIHSANCLALANLGQFDRAEHHLNHCHQMTMRSASEFGQHRYFYTRGIYELRTGNPDSAIGTLTDALSIIEPLGIQIAINRTLIALVEAEIQLVNKSSHEDSSGPWMIRLESHSRNRNYPGIEMHAALLRAEYFTRIGSMTDAKKVLENALTILDSPTVASIKKKIEEKLNELAVS